MVHLLSKSQNPIYELETLPVLIAMSLWRRLLIKSQVVFYIDNDAAKSGLIIKGAGATDEASRLTCSALLGSRECHPIRM